MTKDNLQEPVGVIAIDNTGFPSLMVRWSHNAYFLGAKVGANLYLGPPLAQPAPVQPVAKVDANDEGYWADILPDRTVKVGQFLYAAAQPDVPLTNDEVDRAIDQIDQNAINWTQELFKFARAIEAKIKEKNA